MKKIVIALLVGLLSLLVINPSLLQAESLDDKQKEIEELERKISDLQGQQKTLSSTISFLNTKIILTQTQISKTQVELTDLEEDIATLSGKINTLNISLDNISSLLLNRISTTYKRSSIAPVTLLFSSQGFSDFLSRLKYLRLVQHHDRRIIVATEQAKANYDSQKDLKLTKQTEVEALNVQLISQKATLARQQIDKKQLLTETKNNEANYQQRLAIAVAELAAIQGIIAGFGSESEVGEINQGNKIASYIPSSSACSTGAHLHFEVVNNQSNQNPFTLLSGQSLEWDNIDSPQNGSGSWDWPVNAPIRITQGYGNTAYSSRYASNFHTGIDMAGSNNDVKAVKKGTLFRGGISCGGGTLRYVRVEHSDDDYDTYYLHVNYI